MHTTHVRSCVALALSVSLLAGCGGAPKSRSERRAAPANATSPAVAPAASPAPATKAPKSESAPAPAATTAVEAIPAPMRPVVMPKAAKAAPFVWVEGESPSVNKMNRHRWWYDKVKKDQLSGGDWISNFNKEKQGYAEYAFDAPEGGAYRFLLRANPTGTSLSYNLDDAGWKRVGTNSARGRTNVAADGKPDLRYVGWMDVGSVELARGAHKIAFRMDSNNSNHGSIDCFTFTKDGSYNPKGFEKPGESAAAAVGEPGRWAFAPSTDRFDDAALLDLSYLNEKEAGAHGFVSVGADGDFVRGDGKAIRFWAAHSGGYKTEANFEDHAKWLAKRGVNLVRWHGNIVPKREGSKLSEFDANARAKLWLYVAVMKRHGIYMTLSPYYPHSTKMKKSWGFETERMTALVFFHPEVQAAYKEWLKAIFLPPNPHTGVPLKDEPAVAIIQMQNEDSMLFWTISSVKGRELAMMQEAFGRFAAKKYGSVDKALAAWDGQNVKGDDAGAGRLGFYHVWELTASSYKEKGRPAGGRGKRLADQTEFWTVSMRDWNEEVKRFLREEIGAKQVFNPGNWKTADPVLLNDAERYSYAAGEVIGVNRYTGGGQHNGKHRGWAIVNGDTYQDVSVLVNPGVLPVALKQVAGHAMIIPESNWVPPTGHQSEGPFLISSYMSLGGVDALYWFSHGRGGTQFRAPQSANGFLPSIGKWVAATPEIAGNYPACALMHRNGYIKRGRPAVHERRSLKDVFERKTPIIAEEGTYDPNRDAGDFAASSSIKQEVDRLAFLVGPVLITYGEDASKSEVTDLGKYIDRDAKVVRSNTGELAWDYGRGLCTLDAPFAQGVTGFLEKKGTFALSDVTIESSNEYATLLVVSMDAKPLGESGNVLIQTGTIARPTGWKVKDASWQDKGGKTHTGYEIVDYGRAPWQVIETDATLTIRNTGLTKAVVLDLNGMAREVIDLERRGDAMSLRLPPDAKYIVLR